MREKYAYAGVAIGAAAIAGVLLYLWSPPARPTPADTGRLRVVATFFPLYDFAAAVGKDKIDLTLLFTRTPEIASFTPADVQEINRADIVIKNGLEFEPILDDLIVASDHHDVAVIDTSVGIAPLGSAEEDEREGGDPHIWLDPANAVIQVGNIRDALIARDPANVDFYRGNAAAYIAELQALDREIADVASRFSRKDFVAFHSAFRYFARHYGLRQAAVIEEFPGKEPSPRYIADTIALIRRTGVTAIFSEPQFSPAVLDAIARDTGLTVRALDPIETGDPARDSYISLMRRNLDVLTEAMQ